MSQFSRVATNLAFKIIRPIIFLQDSERVHERFTILGEKLGQSYSARQIIKYLWQFQESSLSQRIKGITFPNPVGLAAGFDYEARLPDILPSLGFGYGAIGTITKDPYEGNPPPRLGRLVGSKSLLVNKGFKNMGIDALVKKIGNRKFDIPIGLSIGKTNGNPDMTQEEAVADVTTAFEIALNSKMNFSYYELNISCPNLSGKVSFYQPEKLSELLGSLSDLTFEKPVFLKMPISEGWESIRNMLEVAKDKAFISGVVIGNLQTNRKHFSFKKEEINLAGSGNFSGKPCQETSDELIAAVYKNYGDRFTIIGCGGIFNAQDAYKKIRAGASLVQLITGMIYEGPQLAGEINYGLTELLRKDGFSSIVEAVGADQR